MDGREVNTSEQRVAAALDRAGLSYVRSAIIGPYEVDFRLGKKVIIEVDGYTHLTGAGRQRDQAKDRYLAELGFTVLRITGDQVHSPELARFVERVRAAVKAERQRSDSDASPSPFAGPLASLRRQLAAKEAQAAATPAAREPDDDSELFLEWVGDRIRPPRSKRK